MNEQKSRTSVLTASKQSSGPDFSLWIEALMTGLEALLQEELARKDHNGHVATDLQRVRFLAVCLHEAARLGLDCHRTGLQPTYLNSGLGLGSISPESAVERTTAAKDSGVMRSQDPLWKLTVEAGMKGAQALLQEELARKDSTGHPATDSNRARALLLLGNLISARDIDCLVRDVRTLIAELEQPSLF